MKVRFSRICYFAFSLAVFSLLSSTPTNAKAVEYTFQNISSNLTSPEQIARYIFRNFVYETDQAQFGSEEHWQAPEELMANRKGDCEDFALFASEILKANGISSFLLNVYGKKFAHTLCVFKENGKFNVIDGKEVKRYNASSLDELFEKIYPHWNSASLVGFSSESNRGRVLKTFQKK